MPSASLVNLIPKLTGDDAEDVRRLHTALFDIVRALDRRKVLATTVDLQGGQIRFPATQNPSSNANTLDDYEEGTWTPVLTFATPGDLSVAYTTQAGFYEKIGSFVRVSYSIFTSTFTHTTASGNYQITGLPFTSMNATGSASHGALAYRGITKAGFTQFGGEIASNDNKIQFQGYASGSNESTVIAADVPTGTAKYMRGVICYRAAA